ncbi:uncharacterized protein BP5553_09651 [Venustampulla echinocandica]|uniref:Uncharacterized protein n=1 Tax=Venustampulla echinocandica TaxID=2656787 RepID=A0A370TBL6_9HELO|nr:uncharacterized protein BP5553_09651 [Venustampulla echinocandica]RDL31442.1 hypothetical protein BP5553_09651 [Venustampulla echinocandica]
MSDGPDREVDSDGENNDVYQSESDSANNKSNPLRSSQAKGQKTIDRTQHQPAPVEDYAPANNQVAMPQREERVTGNLGGANGAIRQSRIKDRPAKEGAEKSALKIKIELDLEVEVDLYARVKGDVTIGLM